MKETFKLTIHIGTEKTGTSSIQKALAADRGRLAAAGTLFPVLFGSENHTELYVGASGPADQHDELQMIELDRQQCGLAEYRDRLRSTICKEIGAGAYSRVLVSNEHCHSRIAGPDMVRQLIELFQVPAEACEVIVYLRRQDRLAVSHYSTILKLGGTARMFPDTGSDHLPRYYDFDRLLQNYAQVVGYEKISVRLYEPAFLVGGDVVRDFYDTVGLGMTPSVTPRVNGSLSLAQAIFLKHFNERFPLVRDGKLNTERGAIFSAIQKVGTGSPFRPDRASAQSFYKHYREGNARVRAQYLPELKRPTLFDEEFSEYPENSSEWTLSESALFDFVEAIWRFKRQH